MATCCQCIRIVSLFIYSTTLANLVYRLLNLISSVLTLLDTQHHRIRIPFSFLSQFVRACFYAYITHTLNTHFTLRTFRTHNTQHTEGVTLRSHARRQFRLAVCCCVCCSQQHSQLTTLINPQPFSTAQHTAHSSTRPPSHRIASYRIKFLVSHLSTSSQLTRKRRTEKDDICGVVDRAFGAAYFQR